MIKINYPAIEQKIPKSILPNEMKDGCAYIDVKDIDSDAPRILPE